jgi:hypothetical protein
MIKYIKIIFCSILFLIVFTKTSFAQTDTLCSEKIIIREANKWFSLAFIDKDSLSRSSAGYLIITKGKNGLQLEILSSPASLKQILLSNSKTFIDNVKNCITETMVIPFFCFTYKDNWSIDFSAAMPSEILSNWDASFVNGKVLKPVIFGINQVK